MTSDRGANLYEVLLPRDRNDGDKPCVLFGTGGVLTFGDIRHRSAKIAGALTANGVRAGDRVMLHVDKSIEALAVFLGCARIGAIFLPLNSAYRRDEIRYFMSDAEPKLAIGRPEDDDWFPDIAVEFGAAALSLDATGSGSWARAVDAESPLQEIARTDENDLAALVYTSGTTGRSKGAMITHRNLISNAETLKVLWGFDEHDILIHALPIFHVHGLFVATNLALLTGIPMRWHNVFHPESVITDFARSTVFMGVPTMYTRLLAGEHLHPDSAAHMRLFVSGSAPLLAETHEAFRARTGHVVLERYGMTETSMITSNPLNGPRKPGTVGLPLPGVHVRLGGEPASGVGGVEVRGPNVFAGYWRRPEATEDFTADGWFKTGDVGRFDDDGYLDLVGRAKDLVISGGYNVYPKEIEMLIDEWPGVIESAVIGVAHPDFGEGVTAVLTVESPAEFDDAALRRYLKESLASFKVPKAIEIVDTLPRNAMGKVQKNVLRDRFADLYGPDLAP